jgi:hypothetical protein
MKSTYMNLQKAVQFSSLPRTFREAIAITRALGIAYLWVDSLCIIQDDDDDWRAESAKMGFVYEQAYCTIAATAASDGSQGCFAQKPNRSSTVELPTHHKNLNFGRVCLTSLDEPRQGFDFGPLVRNSVVKIWQI